MAMTLAAAAAKLPGRLVLVAAAKLPGRLVLVAATPSSAVSKTSPALATTHLRSALCVDRWP